MSSAALIRLGGLAAILAGVLRTAAAFFATMESSIALEWLYLLIDVLLLFGLVGVYAYQHAESGIWGAAGFLLAAIGLESIGGPDGKIGDVDVYTAGATLVGIGLVVLAVGSWRGQKLPRYVPILWVLSTVAGMSAFLVAGSTLPFQIAGIAFGLGFVGAGIRLWSDLTLTSLDGRKEPAN
jgi:hypothetical protein